MNLIKLSYFLFFIFLPIIAFSQGKEVNNWYFGANAGITFNTSSPSALLDGQLNTVEGCATISDSNGDLLFYTDGLTIYTKSHSVMQNGSGLWGNSSATQSGVIVPAPNNPDKFYVFTVESNLQLPNTRMAYSIVDLTYNSGLGKVISKNNLLFTPSSEKIAAVRKTGTPDIWVIGRKHKSNRFSAYLVTESGVSDTPIYSFIGKVSTEDGDNLGYLKPSSDGTKMVNALQNSGIIEIFDFNDQTGVLSNLISLEKTYYKFMYGIEFSPSGRYLYAKTYYQTPQLFQFDLSSGNQTTILNSEYIIQTSTYSIDGALQIGPDGRIYSSPKDGYYLGIIENPEAQGSDVIYTKDGIHLGGRKSKLGLPTFIQSYFLASDFTYENICLGDGTEFTITNLNDIQSVFWNFGDPSSGSNTSTNFNPTHTFSAVGIYTVTLEMTYPTSVEEAEVEIEIFDSPTPDIGSNYTICSDENLILDPGSGYSAYEWQDGSTNQTYSVTASGTYSVEVTNNSGCKGSDDAQVTIIPIPNAYPISGGGAYCEGEPGVEIGLTDSQSGVIYTLLKNGITTGITRIGSGNSISFGTISADGNYTVFGLNGTDCEQMMIGSVDVETIQTPEAYTISEDLSFCEGTYKPINLSSSENNVIYKLYRNGIYTNITKIGTGSEINFGTFSQAGTYTIKGDRQGCTKWMIGSCIFQVYPNPSIYSIIGGGDYCEGGNGVEIELSDSDIGITYTLIRNGLATGNEKSGTGNGISFGQITAEGNYTVMAKTNNGCEEMMASSVEVIMILNPILFDISSGGNFCQGEDGIAISLKQSELGVIYKLYKDGDPTLVSFTGTGFSLDFGTFDIPGTYTILAEKNFCTEWMNGLCIIIKNSRPEANPIRFKK